MDNLLLQCVISLNYNLSEMYKTQKKAVYFCYYLLTDMSLKNFPSTWLKHQVIWFS